MSKPKHPALSQHEDTVGRTHYAIRNLRHAIMTDHVVMPRPGSPEWEAYVTLTHANMQERKPDPRITLAVVDQIERSHYWLHHGKRP